jgi:hypothetical protein
MSYLISQENKKLLWEILAEEGIFDGIPNNVTPEEVKHVFEKILKNLSANIPALHAAKLKELYHAKQQAIADEDYDTAKKIHAMILEMDTPVAKLEKLEERKLLAVKSEDFETAKQIKLEIERIRMASFSLKELNKIAIKSLVLNIPKIAKDISMSKTGGYSTATGHTIFPMASNNTHPPQNAHVQEIYNAEDFHSRKRQEIETKLREKEAEMRALLEVPRPQEIDFSDVPRDKKRGEGTGADDNKRDDDNDSPLANNSDDMEKIIAERIAARQRDLDEITERMKATNPSQTFQSSQPSSQPIAYSTNDLDAPTPHTIPGSLLLDSTPPNNGRKVRFQEDTENPIFLKLKRKPME